MNTNKRKRLSTNERKEEILLAGLGLFREKGFVHTTMEDIVKATSLSKGGVYHYYKSTIDILHDLMCQGIEYRMKVMDEAREKEEKNGESCVDNLRLIVEGMYEKIVDDNVYMDVYAEFLIVKKDNEKLEDLFQLLKQKTLDEFRARSKVCPDGFLKEEVFELITNYINSMIIGATYLGARDNFKEHKEEIIEALMAMLGTKK